MSPSTRVQARCKSGSRAARTDGSCCAISDNGKGISADDQHKPGSFGLLGMHERVRGIGGVLRIRQPTRRRHDSRGDRFRVTGSALALSQ